MKLVHSEKINEVLIHSICKQILLGLKQCHNHNIIHRNLTLDSILVNYDGLEEELYEELKAQPGINYEME